ncbi:glycosyltransferase [Candidatus Peregrinibacteria bacterium]|nr:glycosyltransferase [Candidatus Peregrinibacteria bacterium]
MSFKEAKIALVFDWMTIRGGAEKVNTVLYETFPNATIFSSIFNRNVFPEFKDTIINTSFLQNLPFAKKKHQLFVNLMPYAYELFDLSKYDIIISSSHSCAKGVITKPESMHICYCHSPMRYAWDNWHSYIRDYKINPLIKRIGKRKMHKLRMWDRVSSDRVDYFIANSNTTRKRIEKYYKRPADVVYPLINSKKFYINDKSKGYYFAAGRLTSYKKFDLLVNTFNRIGLPLKIAGTGIEEKRLKKIAKPNIEFLGYVSDKKIKKLYSECEAFLFPQLEDFGITALEAMASGRPVIAYKQGGALDTIKENTTGIFFEKQDPVHLKVAIEKYQKMAKKFDPQKIKSHAEKFDKTIFKENIKSLVKEKWEEWNKS